MVIHVCFNNLKKKIKETALKVLEGRETVL